MAVNRVDPNDPLARARQSAGSSQDAILQSVARLLETRHTGKGTLVDIGCGVGNLWPVLQHLFSSYVGADVLRYEKFPASSEFCQIDPNTGRVELPDEMADVTCAIETIEHVENPRAFARELTRITRPGGWIVITTPNQLSLLSKLTLVVFNEFNAFRAGSYPAHLTALLEVDLRRIARECGWIELAIEYTRMGRMPGTPWHWPKWLSRLSPRRFSDNILLIGRKRTN